LPLAGSRKNRSFSRNSISFSMRSSPLASNPSLALSRSTTVHVQSRWAGLPQLGVLVSIWMGHSPLLVPPCGIELVEGPVVTAPRVGFLKQVGPNVLRGEEFNRIGHPDARQVRMPVQPVARFTTRHRLSAGGAFGAARTEVEDALSPAPEALLHNKIDRIITSSAACTSGRYDWAAGSHDR
jgi:hypothetical protein